MQLLIGKGVTDVACLGMTRDETLERYGLPSRRIQVDDEETREDWQYNDLQMTFRFHENERLGWIQCENPAITFNETPIIGTAADLIVDLVKAEGFREVEIDEYESFSTYFWTDAWLELQHSYGLVRQVNLGVLFKDDDSYDWPDRK